MRQVYICDFCGYMGTRVQVSNHEKICPKNPNVETCENCKYCLDKVYQTEYGESLFQTSPKFCSYKVENGITQIDYPGYIHHFCDLVNPTGWCENYSKKNDDKYLTTINECDTINTSIKKRKK